VIDIPKGEICAAGDIIQFIPEESVRCEQVVIEMNQQNDDGNTENMQMSLDERIQQQLLSFCD
jgi:hypothetical protein